MKKIVNLSALLILALLTSCTQKKVKKITAKRVVIIGLDGISVDGFNTAKTPKLDELMADGMLSLTTRNVMPSYTLPNWTSHLTGSQPEQHGVLSNSWKLNKQEDSATINTDKTKQFASALINKLKIKNKTDLPAIKVDKDGYYPSIFKLVKDSIPNIKTSYYYNWKELINSMNPKYFDEANYQENDEYLENYDKAYNFIVKNQNDPALVFLYSVHTDHAGHKYGWMSPEYITSIEEVDVHIGKFIEKLKKDGLYEDTHFMFFTDHGGIPRDGDKRSGHGGKTLIELQTPWFISGPGIRKGKLTEPNNTVNSAVTIAYLFGLEKPLEWTGEVPMSIFETQEQLKN